MRIRSDNEATLRRGLQDAAMATLNLLILRHVVNRVSLRNRNREPSHRPAERLKPFFRLLIVRMSRQSKAIVEQAGKSLRRRRRSRTNWSAKAVLQEIRGDARLVREPDGSTYCTSVQKNWPFRSRSLSKNGAWYFDSRPVRRKSSFGDRRK